MLAPTKTFGRYTIVREIGRGGMGAVFEAQHSQLKKLVALKTMHGAALDPRAIERFLREGRAAASVRHPHIVDVSDVGVEDGTPFLVMELLDGEDLSKRIATAAPLSVEETVDLMLPVIDAVRAMHERGIVHRDLKPENIFLSRGLGGELVPKVLDFGVCRQDSDDARRLTEGAIVGTPFYLSPEQVDGARGDPQSDQHALGVILYECLSGQRPFDAPTLLGLLAAIRDSRRAPLHALRADLPASLANIVERALDAAPTERFESVGELARALVPFASERARARWEPIVARAPEPRSAKIEPPIERSPEPAEPLAAATLRQGSPPASADEPRARTQRPDARPRSRRALVVTAALAASAAAIGLTAAAQRPHTQSNRTLISTPTVAPSAARAPATEAPTTGLAPVAREDASVAAVTAPSPGPALPPRRSTSERAGRGRARDASAAPVAHTQSTSEPPSSPAQPAVNDAPIVD
ncbi:MAG: protein kinase [Myxococcales bacterium]|nr:protein kinase [Myxococcales bacterium]